jgi:fructose-1,6-bisphosphatase
VIKQSHILYHANIFQQPDNVQSTHARLDLKWCGWTGVVVSLAGLSFLPHDVDANHT